MKSSPKWCLPLTGINIKLTASSLVRYISSGRQLKTSQWSQTMRSALEGFANLEEFLSTGRSARRW